MKKTRTLFRPGKIDHINIISCLSKRLNKIKEKDDLPYPVIDPSTLFEIKMAQTRKLYPLIKKPRHWSELVAIKAAMQIKEFGLIVPIAIEYKNKKPNGEIESIKSGHSRMLGAQMLGLKKVPVVNWDALNETQKIAFSLYDYNKIISNNCWDTNLLNFDFNSVYSEINKELSVFQLSEQVQELQNILIDEF